MSKQYSLAVLTINNEAGDEIKLLHLTQISMFRNLAVFTENKKEIVKFKTIADGLKFIPKGGITINEYIYTTDIYDIIVIEHIGDNYKIISKMMSLLNLQNKIIK